MTVATVMLPTTGDRGPILPLSVGSIQAQTVRDIEIFIMGDGVDDATRAVILDLAAQDPRIRFFDHPKHERRGEPHRHAALAEARGEIVCYLTDRDLMLPHHVAVMADLLRDADFGHTLRFGIGYEGEPFFGHTIDITDAGDRATLDRSPHLIPLAFAGHTLAMYRRLPHGWRTTPPGLLTDRWMWEQFLAQPDCRTASSTMPTLLYFNRSAPPAWSTPRRLEELRRWYPLIADPAWVAAFVERVRDGAIRDRARLARDAALRIRGLEEKLLVERERAVRRQARAVAAAVREVRGKQKPKKGLARLAEGIAARRTALAGRVARWRRHFRRQPPRSAQAHVSDLVVRRLGPAEQGLRLEVYWLGPPSGPGPAASVYAGDDEVMRLDCFGGGRGHMHVAMRQARLLPNGGGARLAFGFAEVEDDIDRAAFELRHDLDYALRVNGRAATRALTVDPAELAAAADWMRAAMLAMLDRRGT